MLIEIELQYCPCHKRAERATAEQLDLARIMFVQTVCDLSARQLQPNWDLPEIDE